MTTLIISGIVLLAIGFFLQSWVLHLLTKLFKLDSVSYRKALATNGIQVVANILIGLLLAGIFYLVGTQDLVGTLTWLLTFIAFHLILKKLYKSSFGKNVAIYLLITIATIIISVIIIIPTRTFIAQPFYMSGNSMEPTLQDGEYILFTRLNKDYMKGDIVVLRSPASNNLLIRKISGVPGEKIQLPNDEIIELKNNKYFVTAENQNEDVQDSYDFGAVNSSSILGKYWFSPKWFDNNQKN